MTGTFHNFKLIISLIDAVTRSTPIGRWLVSLNILIEFSFSDCVYKKDFI